MYAVRRRSLLDVWSCGLREVNKLSDSVARDSEGSETGEKVSLWKALVV